MKESLREYVLLMLFNLLIAGSMGCATMYTTSAISSQGKSHDVLALTDEVVAIGRPDPVLLRELGKSNVVAFLGLKNTYMLFKGGEELENIARGNLDGDRIVLDTTSSQHLYLKDKQVWGNLLLIYRPERQVSSIESETLTKLGFSPRGNEKNAFERYVYVEGVLYPAIKLSNQQGLIRVRRAITLYRSEYVQPPPNYAAVVLLPLAIATDIVLTPVYLGFGLIAITAAVVSD